MLGMLEEFSEVGRILAVNIYILDLDLEKVNSETHLFKKSLLLKMTKLIM